MALKKLNSRICYSFDQEGSQHNLHDLLRFLKRIFLKREDVRSMKLVFFTAFGEGPARAHQLLREYTPKIVAVTFPPTYKVKVGESFRHPDIQPEIRKWFGDVGIEVLTGRLPFDGIDGADSHNHDVEMIKKVYRTMGNGFYMCIEAVLQACDMGKVENGEKVLAISGDTVLVVTASTTQDFLSTHNGLFVNEVICKPGVKHFSSRRPLHAKDAEPARQLKN